MNAIAIDDYQERRRLALLQAAAILLPTYIADAAGRAKTEGYDAYLRSDPRRIAITEAAALLAEIEARETTTENGEPTLKELLQRRVDELHPGKEPE